MAENRRSELFNGSLAGGATQNVIVSISDQDTLVLTWAMSNATAAGDLTNFDVRVVEPVTGAVLPTVLTPEVVHTNALVGSTVAAIKRYDVRGLSKIQVRMTNGSGSARDSVIVGNSYWG